MQLTGIKIRIETRDVAAALEFYTQIIGLNVLQNWGDSSGAILGFELDSNGFLEIAYAAEPKRQPNLSLQFRVKNISDFVKHVGDRWPRSAPTPRPWGSTYLYLQDPDGIDVIVYEGKV